MVSVQELKIAADTAQIKDDALKAILDEARDIILAYTQRTDADWLPVFDGVQLNIAKALLTRWGADGLDSLREGSVTAAFSSVKDGLITVLAPYRAVKVR